MTLTRNALFIVATLLTCPDSWSAINGTIKGTLRDPSGAVIVGAGVIVTNQAQGIQTKTKTDENGVYTFPSLPVGRYELHFEAQGFKLRDKTGLKIDIDSALTEDATLELAQRAEKVTVVENTVALETT